MAHVFISYKHEDLAFAQELALFAQSQRVPIWLDTHIQPGEEWREAIDKAIAEAFAVVVVMTPEARLSEYITYEWAFAMGLRIPVIPVLLRPTPLHPKLEIFQYLDFTRGASMPLWMKLIERLQSLQRAQPSRPAQQTIPRPQPTPEEEMRQSIIKFFTSTPLHYSSDPGIVYGLAKDIIGQFEQGTFSDRSFEMKVAQARNSPGQEWQAKAANLEAALALVRKLGLSSATHDLNQMFLRMGMPAIPKR